MTTVATTSLLLVLFFLNDSLINSQTWEESNDPDNLCTNAYTGYKATLDCRGYVYCNKGYLMGGDIIPCWPNQLFDEVNAVCTSWQSVTESLGDDLSKKCPQFDGNMMMPEDVDKNANPQLFFCGVSTFNAKSVCEPCPGGSRLECSNPTHNCFAGVTGCPVSSSSVASTPEPPPSTAGSPTAPNPPPVTPRPSPNPTPEPTPNPSPTPIEPSLDIELTNPVPDTNAESDITNSFYLHGKLRSSYYCGFSWDLVIKTCSTAYPCPSGLNSECPMSQTCFPDTPCAELQTPPPTPMPTPKPTSINEATYYCGPNWSWVVENCAQAIPCPYGDANGVCPDGYKCIADTPCDNFGIVGPNSSKPTPLPTKNPTFPPVQGDDPANRYCGYNWSDVTENCLTAIPCPGGVAFGVCPDGMNCIAETPCSDDVYLDWLKDKLAKQAAEAQATTVVPTTITSDEGNAFCTEDSDCDTGLFCNKGYCGQCLEDGTGCSVDQICKTATCAESQDPGATQCYTVTDLDIVCQNLLSDVRAICITDMMACEIPIDESEQTQSEDTTVIDSANLGEVADSSAGVAMYENPEGNAFFCGVDYYSIKNICLQSKPCPGGFASGFCSSGEGCFAIIECQSEYETAVYVANNTPSPVTDSLTLIPTRSPLFALSLNTVEPQSLSSTNTPSESPMSSPIAEPSDLHASTNPTIQQVNGMTAQPTKTGSTDNVSNEFIVTTSPTLHLAISPTPQFIEVTAKPTTVGSTNDESNESIANASPTLHPATAAPTEHNTNFCGVSWSSHTEDCENARPCPDGDECAEGETCFTGSPCALLNSASPTIESNMKHLCGTDWNTLIMKCENATPCPRGDECADGEICYRNFECNTSTVLNFTEGTGTNSDITNQSSPEAEEGSTEAVDESDATLSSDSNSTAGISLSSKNDPTPSPTNKNDPGKSTTQSTPASQASAPNEITLATGDESLGEDSQKESTDNSALTETSPTDVTPTEDSPILMHCDLCGSAGQFDYNQYVNYQGQEGTNKMPCGELIWLFAENNIYEGSSECLATRAKYFGECCYVTPENECELCPSSVAGKARDVYLDKKVLFNDMETSCSQVKTYLGSKFESSSETCLDAQQELSDECCFEKCSLCGNLQTDWEASVYFSGEDTKCNEFDIMFREEGVTADSSRCEMTQGLYADECCVQPLADPCDICQFEKSGKHLKSGATVTYNGETTTCLGVYTYLFSLKENASEQCDSAQKELIDQCCEVLITSDKGNGQQEDPTKIAYDRAPEPASPQTPTTTPLSSENLLTSNWYAGSLASSSCRFFVGSEMRWIPPLFTFLIFSIPIVFN